MLCHRPVTFGEREYGFNGDGSVFPFESSFLKDDATEFKLIASDLQFMNEIYHILKEHTLWTLLGVSYVTGYGFMTGMEFTEGAANLIIPREICADKKNVEAFWTYSVTGRGTNCKAVSKYRNGGGHATTHK